MPSRRRPKSSPSPSSSPASGEPSGPSSAPGTTSTKGDPAELFAAAVRESEARDKAARERQRQQSETAAIRAAEQAAHADALATAHRDLDRAIQAVRDAKQQGRSTVQADAAWKSAKARVIELETGAPPAWAPTKEPDAEAHGATDDEPSPLDDGAIGEE